MRFTPEQSREIALMMSGEIYDATDNSALLELRDRCQNLCHDYNLLRPTDLDGRDKLIRQILGRTGSRLQVIQPFFCDYGFNIEVGERFFANTNLVILDEAKVTFGDNVFIAPNCAFYTACHPVECEPRNSGQQFSLPITVGNDVWIGGNVVVLAGVTIGDRSVIGAGSVVTCDIPHDSLAVGNPCRVIRKINNGKA